MLVLNLSKRSVNISSCYCIKFVEQYDMIVGFWALEISGDHFEIVNDVTFDILVIMTTSSKRAVK